MASINKILDEYDFDDIKEYGRKVLFFFSWIWYKMNEYKGLSILILTILMCLYGEENILFYVISGSIFYTMILLREFLDHKKEKDQLDSLDLHYFESADKEFEDPLDGYVDLCINEYMILNRGYRGQAYISKKEEASIRKEILDIMSQNLSPLMKKKFEMYYGKDRVPAILARKCFIKISLISQPVLSSDTAKYSRFI